MTAQRAAKLCGIGSPIPSRFRGKRSLIAPFKIGHYPRHPVVTRSMDFTEEGLSATSSEGWVKISNALVREGVKIITSEQLVAAQSSGATVVDVRPLNEWEESHVPGSVCIQLYRPIEGWSPLKIARRMGYAAFGVLDGTEVNERFFEEMTEAVDTTDAVILVCNMGGALEKTTYYENGQPTRSLIAAYELIRNGYQDVRVHKGGILGWGQEEREFYTVNYDSEDEE